MNIKVKNLSKSFKTQNVLKNLTIDFPSNLTTTVVGPSGTGKSVMLKLITGLFEADSGSILFDNIDFTNSTKEVRSSICRKIGFLFQGAALFDSITVLENVMFPLIYSEKKDLSNSVMVERAREELKKVDMLDYENALPGEISIGMRKRVGIARAMITKPEILLFDEPNTGLDPLVGQEIYDLIKDLKRESKFTGIIVSHELPEVYQVSDKIVMLYGGDVHFDGSVSEFENSENPVVKQFKNGDIEGPIKPNQ